MKIKNTNVNQSLNNDWQAVILLLSIRFLRKAFVKLININKFNSLITSFEFTKNFVLDKCYVNKMFASKLKRNTQKE